MTSFLAQGTFVLASKGSVISTRSDTTHLLSLFKLLLLLLLLFKLLLSLHLSLLFPCSPHFPLLTLSLSCWQVVGGMTWCITASNIEVDADLLFQENSTIGQKM